MDETRRSGATGYLAGTGDSSKHAEQTPDPGQFGWACQSKYLRRALLKGVDDISSKAQLPLAGPSTIFGDEPVPVTAGPPTETTERQTAWGADENMVRCNSKPEGALLSPRWASDPVPRPKLPAESGLSGGPLISYTRRANHGALRSFSNICLRDISAVWAFRVSFSPNSRYSRSRWYCSVGSVSSLTCEKQVARV